MFFTRLAQALAFIALFSGAFQVALGIAVISGALQPEALARYASGSATPGGVIDKGAYAIFFAIALGTLAEISVRPQKI